ncbi:hypothetical protein C6499_14485 [Candidatus Poribacteria bacterium]|nr:MAG: hypothetical protein C6499_14485 [Candidatus Poribacteria bacterium]
MISQNRSYQIIQGVMSLLLGCISIALLVTLRHSGYPNVILATFLVVGVTLIFSGDYLLNPFRLPVTPVKQELASDIGLIAYGALYFSIAMSNLLQPRWFTVGLPVFLEPIWVRRGLAGVGIVLIVAGIYGIYHLYAGQLSDNSPE